MLSIHLNSCAKVTESEQREFKNTALGSRGLKPDLHQFLLDVFIRSQHTLLNPAVRAQPLGEQEVLVPFHSRQSSLDMIRSTRMATCTLSYHDIVLSFRGHFYDIVPCSVLGSLMSSDK